MLNKFQLPPLSSEDIFEQFICDLYNLEFPRSSFQLFGKKGNKQDGIDIISTKKRIAIQCKKKEIQRNNKGVLSELKAEFEQCIQASLVFNNEIDELVFASTYNDSAELIKHLIGLKKKYTPSFNLVYIGWQTIEEKAQKHFSLLTKYYPSLFDAVNIRMRIPFFDMGLLEGRTELLNQIEEFSNKHSAFVLYGVGGIGKSVVLASYINIKKNHEHYNNIVWIESQLDSLRNEIIVRLSTLFFANQNTKDEVNWDILLQKLSDSRGKNLFVIDGVEAVDQMLLTTIDDICSVGWQVIITSRAKIPDFPSIHIEGLSLDDAKLIFNRYCRKEDDENTVEKVLFKLACHPLLVELVAKAVEANPKLTLRDTLELLKDEAIHDSALQRLIHIGRHSKKYSSEYEHKIFKYLLLCFTPDTLSPMERKQLVFFTVLPHSSAISYDFYLSITGQRHSDKLIQALTSLDKKGYISFRKGEYYIHTIVQLVIREKLKVKVSKVKTIALNCTRELKDILEKPSSQLTVYIAIARNILNFGVIEMLTVYLAQFYATAMVRMGEYVRAVKYYEDCLEFLEKNQIGDTALLSSFLNNLGSTYGYVGEYDKAIGCLWSALRLKEEMDEEEEASLAISLDNFATILEKTGRYKEAQRFTLEAIDIFEKYNLESNLAVAYTNLANSYAFTMQLKKAFSYWKKGYKLLKRHFQPDSLRFADSYNAIGMTYLRSHHPMKAKRYFYKSLAIYKQENNAHILAIGYSNIALCEILLGQLEEAKSHLDKSMSLQKSVINGGDDNIASILLNMGEYYIAVEDCEMALKVLKKAIKIYDRYFDSHPEAEKAKAIINHLESREALYFCQQINGKHYMYTLWEMLETNLDVQRKIINDYGKVLYLRDNDRTNISHDYIFFCFTKCTKTIKAVLVLIKKGYPVKLS
ncbi:tetratricopeptide repeat protein [Sphingobacterium spiritivorum]|uniref:tetratricopeptide repeat protein n=1 Tax=Sphingobacterium spiritivorum TaxID=258 RepID=UPI003DA43DCA